LALPIPQREATLPAEAEPVIVKQGWNPRTVIMIGGLIVAIVAAIFFWLGHR
jgi:hypothetical protein